MILLTEKCIKVDYLVFFVSEMFWLGPPGGDSVTSLMIENLSVNNEEEAFA